MLDILFSAVLLIVAIVLPFIYHKLTKKSLSYYKNVDNPLITRGFKELDTKKKILLASVMTVVENASQMVLPFEV